MNPFYSFTLGGITFTEPNLFLTDMLMAVVGFYCFVSLKPTLPTSGYTRFFLFTAFATLVAGFGHLFSFYTGQYLKVLGWTFSLLANFFIVGASLQQLAPMNIRKSLSVFATVKLVIFLALLIYVQQFTVVTIDTVISIALIALPIHLYKWKQTHRKGYQYFCVGIGFTMLTALVGGLKLSISEMWFNDKDINHLIICGGMLWMHAGLKQL
jgi:hypothetical protein